MPLLAPSETRTVLDNVRWETFLELAEGPFTFNGLVKAAQVTYNVNSHTVQFGSMAYLGGSTTRSITVNGSGTLSIGTTVWTKSGTATLAVNTLNTTGTNGVQLFLTGELPSSNSTILSYSEGLTGSFSKIWYDGTEPQLGQPSEALGDGLVDVSGNSLVYLAVVPEPATLGLLAAGGMVFVLRRLRRRRRPNGPAACAGPVLAT